MRRIDELHLEFPFAGSRMLRGLLAAEGSQVGRRHVKTLMKRMGIEALYRRPRTTKPEPGRLIRPILAHSTLGTAERHYIQAGSIEAGRDYAAVIKCMKRETR
jgi:hypothetical protein